MVAPRPLVLTLMVVFFSIVSIGFMPVSTAYAAKNEAATSSSFSEVTLLINSDYHKALLQHINAAANDILVGVYIFKSSPRPGLPGEIIEALAEAAQRGVKVRVLFEQSNDNKDSLNNFNQDTARKLIKSNILVCFDSPKQTTHSKLVVIDGRYVFIGSHNFTPSGLGRNNEVSVLIDSPKLALSAKKYLYGICRQKGTSR